MPRSSTALRILPTLILLATLVVGCSDDSSPTDPGPDPEPSEGVLFVDQAMGDDDNPGTEGSPFATITAALDAVEAIPGIHSVRVGPGIYGAGEGFPLRLPAGVRLIGDEASRGSATGNPTEVRGFGPFSLTHGDSPLVYQSASILGADSTEVRGFRITAPESVVNVGVAYVGDGPGMGTMTLARNTIAEHHTGILADGVGAVLVEDNLIEEVDEGATFYSAQGVVFRDNTVRAEGQGVDIAVGTDGSLTAAGNHFEIMATGGTAVYAQAATPLIEDNTVVSADGVAPFAGILAGNGSPVLRGNRVTVSPAVLAWNSSDVDMGDESTPGENDFSQVEGLVLDVRGAAHVVGRGNIWPHDPPRYGEDLIVSENGSVDLNYRAEVWVDVDLGDDAGDGSQGAPLQTITAALQAAPRVTRVNLAPGTYGPLETFPLMMHPGMLLIGNEADRGDGIVIEGEGEHATQGFDWATIVGAPGAEIVGVTLRSQASPFGYFGLMVDEGPMTVRRNTFANGYGAITAATGVALQILENTVNTDSYGFYTVGTEETRVEGNDVTTHIPANLRTGLFVDNDITINSYTGAMQASQSVRVENNRFVYQRESGLDMRYAAILVSFGSPYLRDNVFQTDRGILVRDGTPDVGIAGDLGGNDFSATTICGIEHQGSEIVHAVGNTWVNDPPQIGEDVLITGEGTVVTSGEAR